MHDAPFRHPHRTPLLARAQERGSLVAAAAVTMSVVDVDPGVVRVVASHDAGSVEVWVGSGPAARRVASWEQRVHGPLDEVVDGLVYPLDAFAAHRSSDRSVVAVLAGEELRVVDLASGVVTAQVAAPRPAECSVTRVVVWDAARSASMAYVNAADALAVPVGGGWRLEVEGLVAVDGGMFTASTSGTRAFFDVGTSRAEMDAALAELAAADDARARAPHRTRYVAARGTARALVLEEEGSLLGGLVRVHWPPIPACDGALLLRRCRHTARLSSDEYAGRSEDPLAPWLVHPDGTVVEIPEPLGISPLCGLPDGSFLLPGEASTWWDGPNEELHRLDRDGQMRPLLVADEPVTPNRVIAETMPNIDPDLLPTEPEQAGWWPTAARVEPGADQLELLLTHVPNDPDGHDERSQWVLASLPLDIGRIERRAYGWSDRNRTEIVAV